MNAQARILARLVLAFSTTAFTLAAAAAGKGVTITKMDDRVRVEIAGELFTEYRFQGAPHVYFYPLIGPAGLPMTRNAPMAQAEGEDRDHPHHRSLWFSHGDVNGIDFWAETPKSGKIVHDQLLEARSGVDAGVIRAAHKWVALDGQTVCTDETTFRVHARSGMRLFDFEITLKAPEGSDVVMGDTKEGTMGIRVAETMRLKPNKFSADKPGGTIVQSTGVKNGDTWGKRAEWCDYYGPVQGKTVGVAIFDHPLNPRHPTWWHVRDYGLFAANPFGIHDFEKKPAKAGNLTIPAGKSITFRYRFYLHEGDTEQAKVAAMYREYVAGGSTK
jgi:hypothetical protein